MRRWSVVALVSTALAFGLPACSDGEVDPAESAGARSNEALATDLSGPDGRIAFARFDPALNGLVTYTVNPDGSGLRQLFVDGPSENPSWSPDGLEVHIFCCDDGMAAHFVDPATGELRTLPQPDPTLELFCGWAWAPDGERLACEGYGLDDPSRNGIYTIRATDGGGLTRITSPPDGYDTPGDFSPDGRRLVFVRFDDNDRAVGVFVTRLNGTRVRPISPRDLMVEATNAGSWSPNGNQILFVARPSLDHHKAIWVVNADGSSPHQLVITPACGGLFSDPKSAGCYWPSWSPDGSRIVFTRSSPNGRRENIYIVNADGSGLVRVTNGGGDDNPDWGP